MLFYIDTIDISPHKPTAENLQCKQNKLFRFSIKRFAVCLDSLIHPQLLIFLLNEQQTTVNINIIHHFMLDKLFTVCYILFIPGVVINERGTFPATTAKLCLLLSSPFSPILITTSQTRLSTIEESFIEHVLFNGIIYSHSVLQL